jgi:signal transduction histidine kinase
MESWKRSQPAPGGAGAAFSSLVARRGDEPAAAGGLGLLIVRRILVLHGSDIRLDGEAGTGAAFRFLLPAA